MRIPGLRRLSNQLFRRIEVRLIEPVRADLRNLEARVSHLDGEAREIREIASMLEARLDRLESTQIDTDSRSEDLATQLADLDRLVSAGFSDFSERVGLLGHEVGTASRALADLSARWAPPADRPAGD